MLLSGSQTDRVRYPVDNSYRSQAARACRRAWDRRAWHLVMQYAKAAGLETIAIFHSPDKDKMVRDLGADDGR